MRQPRPRDSLRAPCAAALFWAFAAIGSGCVEEASGSNEPDAAAGFGGAPGAAGAGGAFGGQAFGGYGASDGGQGTSEGGTAGGVLAGPPCDAAGLPGTCETVSDCTAAMEPVPGYCDGPAETQCCVPVGAECNPDAAPQPNVGLVEGPGEGGCPAGMVAVEDFCIDRFEASLVYAESGEPFSPYVNPGGAAVRAVSIEGAVPQGYISQTQAAAACEAADKRLCFDDEWLRACQGPDEWLYPYGATLELGTCNDHRDEHPAIEYFGTSDDWIWSELGHPCLNQLDAGLDPSGTRQGCLSVEGAFDLMGNLHEWTADPNGTFRGGFYVDTVQNGPGCLYATTVHGVSHWDYSTGFRCCASP